MSDSEWKKQAEELANRIQPRPGECLVKVGDLWKKVHLIELEKTLKETGADEFYTLTNGTFQRYKASDFKDVTGTYELRLTYNELEFLVWHLSGVIAAANQLPSDSKNRIAVASFVGAIVDKLKALKDLNGG